MESPPSSESERPLVLVASADPALVERFENLLGRQGEVAELASLRELVLSVASMADPRIVAIVDCRRPSIRPTAIAALADELSPAVTVLLWGASPQTLSVVRAISHAASAFLPYSAESSAEKIAADCKALLALSRDRRLQALASPFSLPRMSENRLLRAAVWHCDRSAASVSRSSRSLLS